MNPAAAELVPHLLGARWSTEAAATMPVFNPSTGGIIAHTPDGGEAEVNEAVAAAQQAFAPWARTPAPRRAGFCFAYKALLEAHFEELAQLVTRENGKTLDEARGDVRRGIEVVDFACGIGHLAKGEHLPQVAEHLDAATLREPLGVCAGITPFNFPAMVPMWMFPLAIACGNTFVLKPSEKVPLTAVRLAQLAMQAGLPAGVLNLVHGGRAVVDALLRHPGIAAISFVGSTPVAEHVYRVGCHHGKRVQSAGGAKNVMVVLPDAEPDPTLRAILGSAYGCAGQRCMAGSILIAVGSAGDPLRDRLTREIQRLRVDDTSTNPQAQMGPMIDGPARDRALHYIEQGQREGAKVVCDGRRELPPQGFFVRPTLLDHVAPGMAVFQDEIFGPVLSMVRADTVEEAIGHINSLVYGNGAVLFTSSGGAAREFAREVKCGMVGINVGIPAPMSLFAFSGWNRSFFGDLHVQGTEGMMFYTRQKIVLARWDTTYRRTQGW